MRVFIIAKTYPELSSRYGETVCTAAVDEAGNPLRLYPIPFRYLTGAQKFKRYQWVDAELQTSRHDARPESRTVQPGSIRLEEGVPATPDEWGRRADIVLQSPAWQFSSMHSLFEAQRSAGRSLAFVRPRLITGVTFRRRAIEDARTFQEKMQELRKQKTIARQQLDLFERTLPSAMKNLEYVGERVCIDWRCGDEDCAGHSMQVLDWEICELARKAA